MSLSDTTCTGSPNLVSIPQKSQLYLRHGIQGLFVYRTGIAFVCDGPKYNERPQQEEINPVPGASHSQRVVQRHGDLLQLLQVCTSAQPTMGQGTWEASAGASRYNCLLLLTLLLDGMPLPCGHLEGKVELNRRPRH